MGVKLTEHQMMIVKGMMEYSQAFADAMFLVMKHHGLDSISGCRLDVSIDPSMMFVTETINFGSEGRASGRIKMTKGRRFANEDFTIQDNECSREYAGLFDGKTDRVTVDEILPSEKPLPPDGLWVGGIGNDSPVGNWEWDVNDSLS